MKLDAINMNPALLRKPETTNLNMAAIEETARDFEAMFMAEMLRPMFEGVKPDSLFGGGKGEEVFNSMMIDEYGKSMASTGVLGIADLVKEQLIQMQAEAHKAQVAQNMHGSSDVATGEILDVQ